jgi:hypothetical protein
VGKSGEVIELGFTFHLLDDLMRCIPHVHGPEKQFWRRTAFRSLFGFLEAWMSVNRTHMVPDALREFGDLLLKTEEDRDYVAGLLGATSSFEWTLADNGSAEWNKRKLRFLPCLKANVRLGLFISGVSREETSRRLGQTLWQDLKHAVKVRDRITHPHEHNDVLVTDDDIQALTRIVAGWQEIITAIKYPSSAEKYDDGSDDDPPSTAAR